MDEYEGYCSYSGAPGVGDMFFKFLHDHQYSETSVIRIPIQQTHDRESGFANLPSNDFDPDDRKFLAVAEAGSGRVVNAVDSDWSEHAAFIDSLGVCVIELCPTVLEMSKVTRRQPETEYERKIAMTETRELGRIEKIDDLRRGLAA